MSGDSGKFSRREFHRLALAAGAGLLLRPDALHAAKSDGPFLHPGILHTRDDLERMKNAVRSKRQPVFSGLEKLRQHPLSSADYKPHPFAEEIGRNPTVNFSEFDSDAGAAYQCALMAAITGETRYAAVARTIVLGWSRSLQRVSGADAVLMAGLGPFKFVNAAELLHYLGELDKTGAEICAAMLRRAILPTIVDFAPFANGNWDTAAIKTMLAVAVFCDDRAVFERALLYYLHGDGDGRLTHYIYENGQCQESGRDQQHTQLGLAHMGDACEIAWNQGWDLYGAHDNRLLRGFEYTAAYNLGETVEFRADVDRTGKYRHKVISPRGELRPVYEQIFAHYRMRCGLPAPAVQKAVERLRPEGASHGADHTGFGTLLYARTAEDNKTAPRPVPPVALYARARNDTIELSWLPPRLKQLCTLQGAAVRAEVASQAGSYQDTRIASGRQYTYRISTHRPSDFEAEPVLVAGSLPNEWKSGAIGNPAVAGDVQFDGKVFALHAAGAGLMQSADEGHFAAAPESVARLRVRFLPQTASQFAVFGIAYRDGFAADAPSAALLVMPTGTDSEHHGWHVRGITRDEKGAISNVWDVPLPEPVVSYGRLVRPVWLSMERKSSSLQLGYSIDAAVPVPTVQTQAIPATSGKLYRLGLIASSGIPEIAGTVRLELIGIA